MKDWTKTCTICGKANCTVGGMHGMIRDRAAEAYRQQTSKKGN